uniref:Uncharacterized protein n=1 Tax=Arundo donax TaxID=35708 RepID=A0A0A8ZQ95_ARUDO
MKLRSEIVVVVCVFCLLSFWNFVCSVGLVDSSMLGGCTMLTSYWLAAYAIISLSISRGSDDNVLMYAYWSV